MSTDDRCPTCDRPPKGQFENRDGCLAFAYSPKERDEYPVGYRRLLEERCLPFAVDWRSRALEALATLDAERQDRAALVAERDRLKAEIVQWRLATNARNPDEAERDVKKWAGELLAALDDRDALTRRVGELEAERDTAIAALNSPRAMVEQIDAIDEIIKERDAARSALAEAEGRERKMREAIEGFFRPGPGCAVPEWHENDYGEPHRITWNKKLDALRAALIPSTPPAPTAPIIPRPEVQAFAVAMEEKLRENDDKRHWRQCSIDYLIGRLREEARELEEAVDAFTWKRTRSHDLSVCVLREGADVGNLAMMIVDKCKGLGLSARHPWMKDEEPPAPTAGTAGDERALLLPWLDAGSVAVRQVDGLIRGGCQAEESGLWLVWDPLTGKVVAYGNAANLESAKAAADTAAVQWYRLPAPQPDAPAPTEGSR